MPLADNDIIAELTYAYLHAVASRVGCECAITGRHSDGMGVDTRLHVDEDFGSSAPLCRFSVEIQLKATAKELPLAKGRFSYRLTKEHYDKLRRTDIESPLLLIVLQLPKEAAHWLHCTQKALTLKRSAHWVSLNNAPESTNDSYQNVYLPRVNLVTESALRALLGRFARRERIPYVA